MKKNASVLAILISLLMHTALVGTLWVAPQLFQLNKRTITEVELLDAQEMLKKMKDLEAAKGQIVDQSEKALNDEIDKNAKFLSRHNQKVKEETRAQVVDKFKNSVGGPKAKATQASKAQEEAPTKDMVEHRDGLAVGKTLKDFKPDFKIGPKQENVVATKEGGDGPSSSDDNIDRPVGMETMLSTREFVYFSYYNRIKDKLRQYWEPAIKQKVTRIFRQGRTIASDAEKITKVIIVLDEKGVLQKVQVIGESGVSDLDDAAVEAFRAAAPFPNPPKGIVEQDGLIRIRWDFILEADARPQIEGEYVARRGQPSAPPAQ